MTTNNLKEKGFTLIELLAVIVILAVIALIAVPRIIEILNKARISAAEDSTMGIVEAAESYVADFMLKNHGAIPSEDLEFACDSTGCNLKTNIDGYNKENLTSLEFKGKKPTSGTITVSDSGKNIIVNNLKISGFICIYDGESSTCGDYKDRVVLSEDFDKEGIKGGYEGVKAIVYLDPTDLTKECNENDIDSTTGKNEGCMKWYAYKDEDGKYTMIADHNITVTVAWTSESNNYHEPKEVLEALRDATTSTTATWSNKLVAPGSYTANWTYNGESHEYTIDYEDYGNRARLISAEEIYEIIGKETKDLNSISIGYMDTNCNDLGKCSTGGNKYAWLFDNTKDCISYGCNVAQIGNFGYWTSSAYASHSTGAWFVDRYGYLGGGSVFYTDRYGVRPVIIVAKSDLLQ